MVSVDHLSVFGLSEVLVYPHILNGLGAAVVASVGLKVGYAGFIVVVESEN